MGLGMAMRFITVFGRNFGTALALAFATHAVQLAAAEALAEPADSRFFSTVKVESRATLRTDSEGDLWPSSWADNDRLYTANGDGAGFLNGTARPPIEERPDIAFGWIEGSPPTLINRTVAVGADLGSIWTPGKFNRKPTGIVCVDELIYLAVQDLSLNFNEAPAASISKSADGGRTWQWDKSRPMFANHQFTTVFFLDYGKNQQHGPQEWIYAYGLDGNWRDSFNNKVPDPSELFLARIPRQKVAMREAWQFYAGLDDSDQPRWTDAMASREPVLKTQRRVYSKAHPSRGIKDMSVLGQGGVVYNAPLQRYLYTSWTEYTFEFFEAPKPWGPWKRFFSYDFGRYPWREDHYGGYAVSIPSKFISADGKTMWLQCNTFVGGVEDYGFSLRKLEVTPFETNVAENEPDATRNLACEPGTVAISKSTRRGRLDLLNDGKIGEAEDDSDGENKPKSWWGYTWPRSFRMNRLVYVAGPESERGGRFMKHPELQIRQDFQWVDVAPSEVKPTSNSNSKNLRVEYHFPEIAADGIRVIGRPGGTHTFTSIEELEVFLQP